MNVSGTEGQQWEILCFDVPSILTSLPALSELTAPVRWEDLQPYTTPDQLSEELLTLSLMPRSRWQTLLNLETIKVSSLIMDRSGALYKLSRVDALPSCSNETSRKRHPRHLNGLRSSSPLCPV